MKLERVRGTKPGGRDGTPTQRKNEGEISQGRTHTQRDRERERERKKEGQARRWHVPSVPSLVPFGRQREPEGRDVAVAGPPRADLGFFSVCFSGMLR